jgi:outer membrane lipoprotein-sorting protein
MQTCNKTGIEYSDFFGGNKVKKTLVIIAAILSVALLANAYAMTVDEIIAKNLEAMGGKENLKAIKTMKTSGKLYSMGMEAPFTMIHKRPNSYRFETTIQGVEMVQAFDGETAWGIMPFAGNTKPQKLPGIQAKMIKEQADMDGFLMDYKEKGYKIELVGKQDLEGTETYLLKVTNVPMIEGMVVNIYLDAEYFIELRQNMKGEYEGQPFDTDVDLGDYKEVDGIMLPHSYEVKMGGQTMSSMIFENIELNADVNDSLFAFPGEAEETESKTEKEKDE